MYIKSKSKFNKYSSFNLENLIEFESYGMGY